jgi:hypothetical protein
VKQSASLKGAASKRPNNNHREASWIELSSVKGSKSINSNVEAKRERAAKQLVSSKDLGSEQPKSKCRSKPGLKEAKESNRASN